MASTYTDRIGLEKQGDGENANTWGLRLNTNVIDLVDEAVAGYETVNVSAATSVVLTDTDGVSNQARNLGLKFTGELTAATTVTIPAQEKIYFVHNGTTGSYPLIIKPAGGTPVTAVPTNSSMIIATDGSTIQKFGGEFESGTRMLFQQSTAPLGWTKSTTHDNKALRIVSGTTGSGGTNTFSSAFNGSQSISISGSTGAASVSLSGTSGATAPTFTGTASNTGYTSVGSTSYTPSGSVSSSGSVSGTVANHTLTLSQIPSHNHYSGVSWGGLTAPGAAIFGQASGTSTRYMSQGSGNSSTYPYTSSSGSGGAHNHGWSGSISVSSSFSGNAVTITPSAANHRHSYTPSGTVSSHTHSVSLSGGSHSHTFSGSDSFNLDVQYVDVIIAQKD
jgi:hypothetical protein